MGVWVGVQMGVRVDVQVGVQAGVFASLGVFCCEAWSPLWPLCHGHHHCCCLAIGSPSHHSRSRQAAFDAAALGIWQIAVLLEETILTINAQSLKQKKNN